jgi:multidrug resistance efflux pump
MLELITAIYGLLCWLLFKKFKVIPINDYTVVTAVFIPVVVYIFGFLILNMNAPVAKDVRLTAPATPIVSLVQGTVVEVPVKPNTPLKKGDVLLRIDDTLYKARLTQAQAQLSLAQVRFKQMEKLELSGVGRAYDRQQFESEVAKLEGVVAEAQYNLNNCTIVAPADGMVTQLVIRPGQFVMPMAFNQLLVFIHNEQSWVGSFPQQALQGIKDGEDAEIAITAAPGHVFSAKVMRVVPALGEGAVAASGQLMRGSYDRPPGRVLVMMKITDKRAAQLMLPIGTDATATIFTSDSEILKLVRGLIMRIKSWEAWVFA